MPADDSGRRPAHVGVVGGGIAGLAAAHRLVRLGGVRVTLLESGPVLGGKLARAELAGLSVDTGAESVLNRRAEATDLARDVGLGDDLRFPVTSSAALWSRGALRPLPPTVLGVPSDLRALARSSVLSSTGVVRAGLDRVVPRAGSGLDRADDVSVGWYVGRRLGAEVHDRLLEPLLGGVYGGHADDLSLAAAAPQILALARERGSLLAAAERARSRAEAVDAGPVFAGLVGGWARLAESVAADAAAAGVVLRTGAVVRSLSEHDPDGSGPRWRLLVGRADRPEVVDVDAVVLATPAAPTARLLHEVVPAASSALRGIDYASVALVTLAVPPGGVASPPPGSGFLVPPVEGRRTKGVTWSSAKWAWVGEQAARDHGQGTTVVRVSFGRHREVDVLQRDDVELVELAALELADTVGLRGPLLDARVDRWGGALPQYAVGHLARVGRAERAVADVGGLEVCGAAYHGLGVPACIADGRAAAERVAAWLRTPPAGWVRTLRDNAAMTSAREINASIRYTMWSVFVARDPLGEQDRGAVAAETVELLDELAGTGTVVRGCYDVSGLRADADLMVWWHAETPETLQRAYQRLRRSRLGEHLAPVWSQLALHRPAEFNKGHVPAFMSGEPPRSYLCVYPFVRSYEWYLLPEAERRDMLVEHGKLAREYPDVRANTVSSFALGDYEWMLAFEADELHRIVDLMRELRASRARRHVREEVPFYTGRRREPAEIVASLP